jgi:hypothetical protein
MRIRIFYTIGGKIKIIFERASIFRIIYDFVKNYIHLSEPGLTVSTYKIKKVNTRK